MPASDTTPTPIVVNASTMPDQVVVGVRYALMTVASIASTLGYAGIAGQASGLVASAGTIAAVLVFLWGQWKTRQASKQTATLATLLPDRLATTK